MALWRTCALCDELPYNFPDLLERRNRPRFHVCPLTRSYNRRLAATAAYEHIESDWRAEFRGKLRDLGFGGFRDEFLCFWQALSPGSSRLANSPFGCPNPE